MRYFIGAVALCSGLVLLAGFGGAIHPAGDSFAVFRIPVACVFVIAVLALRGRWWVRLAGSVAVGVVVYVSVTSFDFNIIPSNRHFVLYQQNLLYSRNDSTDWLAAIDTFEPDFITLQEVSLTNSEVLMALAPRLPTLVSCDFGGAYGVAVLSRFEMIDGTAICANRDGMAAMQVRTPDGPVWIISIHLRWPWPYDQAAQVERLIPMLEALEGPVIIGGDFNSAAWSNSVARIAQASGTQVAGRFKATFNLRGLPIGIDHVLSEPTVSQTVHVQPKLGSDHHGLLAYITRTAR